MHTGLITPSNNIVTSKECWTFMHMLYAHVIKKGDKRCISQLWWDFRVVLNHNNDINA